MMIKGSLPFRYARALMSLAEQANSVDVVAEELKRFQSSVRQIPKLATYLADVVVARSDRRQILIRLLDELAVSDVFRRFILFLLDRERLAAFDAIVTAFGSLCDERSGLVRAKVLSAKPLSAELSTRIEKMLAEKTGRQVAVEYTEDPSLIGGMVIQMGSKVYDGSVRGDLKRAQEDMLKQGE